ncbi:MAG: hypothetical protein ACRDZW_07445, partial [Acidimicrobiales bacterium]
AEAEAAAVEARRVWEALAGPGAEPAAVELLIAAAAAERSAAAARVAIAERPASSTTVHEPPPAARVPYGPGLGAVTRHLRRRIDHLRRLATDRARPPLAR